MPNVIVSLVGKGGVVDAVLVVHAGARVHAPAQNRQEFRKEPENDKLGDHTVLSRKRVARLRESYCGHATIDIVVFVTEPKDCKSPRVHVPAHLVEDEPVADGAVLGVVLHVAQVGVRLEVAADPGLHHLVPHPLRAHLRVVA